MTHTGKPMQMRSLVRWPKWAALLALVHYSCVWCLFIAPIFLLGDIDAPHSALSIRIARILESSRDVLLEPLVQFGKGEPSSVIHIRMLLNSLLWGAAGTLLMLMIQRVRRLPTNASNETREIH